LIIIAGVTLLGFGLIVLWRQFFVRPEILPELPVVEISPSVPQSAIYNYRLQATLPAVTKIPVYKFKKDVVAQFIARWPRALGFGGLPQRLADNGEESLYLWSKEGETLVIDEGASSLSYRVDLHADPNTLTGSFLPTFEQAVGIVEQTLQELEIASNLLEYDPTKNKALRAGVSLVQETTLAEAELLEVRFSARIGDYPLYLESGPGLDPAIAWVGKEGKLLRLDYHSLGAVGEKIGDYPLKNKEEVLQSLDRGEGVVVSTSLEGGEEMVATAITKVELGYLLPSPDTAVLQPVFVLSGKAQTVEGKTGNVVLYLKAAR